MLDVSKMTAIPGNFGAFVREISPGVAGLYGEAAGVAYTESAPRSLQATLCHPAACAFSVSEGPAAAGFLLGLHGGAAGQISFMHVLAKYAGQRVEERLLRAAVSTFEEQGHEGIVSECIPFCSLDLDATYLDLGFEKIPRRLMAASLRARALDDPAAEGVVCSEEDALALGEVIAAAYEGHPGRLLHGEVRNAEAAREFVLSAFRGGYGRNHPGFVRAIERDRRTVAAVVGCEVAPEVGFVLQLAVLPDYRGRGLGTQLIRELAQRFRQAGLKRAALGVTVANAARRLYERLGFKRLRDVDAFTRWGTR